MDVGLVAVLPLRVLVRPVSMTTRRLAMLMHMTGYQVPHLPAVAVTGMVGHVNVLVAVDHSLMRVRLHRAFRHGGFHPFFTLRVRPRLA